MKIERKTAAYNQRRYGRPWIARVVIKGGQLDYQWGQWIGDHSNGSEGLLIIDLEVGDVFARGQKDFKKPKNSAPNYLVLGADGKGEYLASKVEAYKLLSSEIPVTAEVSHG